MHGSRERTDMGQERADMCWGRADRDLENRDG